MPDRCTYRVPKSRTPDGWTVEQLQQHPTYRHLLEPGAQCELDAGHAPPHQAGLIRFYDPPVVVIR